MDALVQNLLATFATSIDELEWMGPATRRAAHDKLAKITVKIGYPDKWRPLPDVTVRRDALVANVMALREANRARELADVGRPVDRSRWQMTPQTVNAYYSPLTNEIVFPAAILQPPFFDARADDAVNYGGIGAVIGHEVSHGFDDQGRKFDGDGKLRDWWTADDDAKFQGRSSRLVDQYASFSPLAGTNVNGELTLGENIGDLSGLTVAYKAYRRSLAGREAPELDGFTGDQRFFIGWAQIWRAQVPRGGAAQAPAHRLAQPDRVPGERSRAQHAPVRLVLRRPPRRQALPAAGPAGSRSGDLT